MIAYAIPYSPTNPYMGLRMNTLFKVYIGLALIMVLTITAMTLEALDGVCIAHTGAYCELYSGQNAAAIAAWGINQ